MIRSIDPIILALILLVPLAGAVLVALLPDRAKLPNWIALAHDARHLPAHAPSSRALHLRPNRLPV